MRFNVAGDQWLDPSTFRVAFRFNNHNGNTGGGLPIYVQPLSWNPACFMQKGSFDVVEVKLLKILVILIVLV